MTNAAPPQVAAAAKPPAGSRLLLQRKCVCGARASAVTGECTDCGRRRALGLQTRMRIADPGDRHEREADRAADEVMRVVSPGPRVAQQVAGRRQSSGMSPSAGRGEPLAAEVRAFMEPRFGRGFEHVRVHADREAAQLARAIGARAFAVDDHLFFGDRAYDGRSADGRRLIAHELAHVAQHERSPGASAVIRRAGDPAAPAAPVGGTLPLQPRETRTLTKEVCPTCICAPDHVQRLEAARGQAARLLGQAATLLESPSAPITRLFESTFGPDSAGSKNVADTAKIFSDAAAFLGKIAVATPGKDGAIHCDQANDTPSCASGATGFHSGGNIVVCGGPQQDGKPGAGALLLNPPEVATQYRVEGTAGSSEHREAMRQVPDPAKTEAAQRLSDAQYAARLVHLLCHEAIHNAVQPGVVDVYRDERLFGYLGKSSAKLGVDLSPLALQNPDSLVQFAFRAPRVDESAGAGVAEAEAALGTSGKLSGRTRVRPVLGRRRTTLMLALAEEAISQAAERVLDLHTAVKAVQDGKSEWPVFSPEKREVRDLLVAAGESLAQPDAAAEARLATLSTAFQRLTKLIHERKLVVGRRFLFDRPEKRIEIAIPDWRAFRSMSPGAQLAILVRALLAEEPVIKGLGPFVQALATKRGGMAALAPREEEEK